MPRKSIIATLLTGSLLLACGAASAQVYKTGDEALSLSDLKARAEAGDGTAQLELGRRYYYDRTMKDDNQAFIWFSKAAEQHVAWAEYEAAAMYENAEATPHDSVAALKLYKQAQADGIELANLDIGVIYLTGETGPADPVEAAKWLQAAANIGEPRAEYLLGTMYRDGTGVQPDSGKAIAFFKASAKQRFQPAAEALEVMYRDGVGVPADPVTSHAWRTMSKYLRNDEQEKKDLPPGATPEAAYLITPKLNLDDNMKAWRMYIGFMEEFGFITGDHSKMDDLVMNTMKASDTPMH